MKGKKQVAGVPDTVERLDEMLRTGVIDYGAYRGEPRHDAEEDAYGDIRTRDGSEDGLMTDVLDEGRDPIGEVAADGNETEEPLADV